MDEQDDLVQVTAMLAHSYKSSLKQSVIGPINFSCNYEHIDGQSIALHILAARNEAFAIHR